MGRGGRRGGSSGRGNGGQKHHGKRPSPWFTGLYTNPLIHALPRWPWAPREHSLLYVPLNLDRLQHWIELGRLDPGRPITLEEMFRSGLLRTFTSDRFAGVKLLSRGASSFAVPRLRLEVSKASLSAIHAVEREGGSVSTVYHSRRALDYLMHPERHVLKPFFERPVLEGDLRYYRDPAVRGYLSDPKQFKEHFLPRGYLADEAMERETLSQRNVHQAQLHYRYEGMEQRLAELEEQRELRQLMFEQEQKELQGQRQQQKERWLNGQWFPGQGDWQWVRRTEQGDLVTNLTV